MDDNDSEGLLCHFNDILEAALNIYRDDPTRPGVTVSALNEYEYYASVVRYTEPRVQGKIVVVSAKAPSLEEVIIELGKRFRRDSDYREAMRFLQGKY